MPTFLFNVNKRLTDKSSIVDFAVQLLDNTRIAAGDGHGSLVALNFADAVEFLHCVTFLYKPSINKKS